MPNINVNTRYHTRSRNIVLELQAGAGGGTVKRAETARRLETPRKIVLNGAIKGDVEFDGSTDAYINTSVDDISLHKLKFGDGQEYVYDGSEDVTVPVYTGDVDNE